MSTRAVILVQDETDLFQIYRHSDGYPDGRHGVLSDLVTCHEYALPLADYEASDTAAAIIRGMKEAGGGGIYLNIAPREGESMFANVTSDIEWVYLITNTPLFNNFVSDDIVTVIVFDQAHAGQFVPVAYIAMDDLPLAIEWDDDDKLPANGNFRATDRQRAGWLDVQTRSAENTDNLMIAATVESHDAIQPIKINLATMQIASGHLRVQFMRHAKEMNDVPPPFVMVTDNGDWLIPCEAEHVVYLPLGVIRDENGK